MVHDKNAVPPRGAQKSALALGANEVFYGARGQDCGDSLNWW